MKALNDPITLNNYVSQEIKELLSPHPSAIELNQYFIEMSERNTIPLEEINVIGHKFSKNISKPAD